MVSKTEYLDQFDVDKNGPLHEQVWCREAMRKFHLDMLKYNQGHCLNCRELWPTTGVNYVLQIMFADAAREVRYNTVCIGHNFYY